MDTPLRCKSPITKRFSTPSMRGNLLCSSVDCTILHEEVLAYQGGGQHVVTSGDSTSAIDNAGIPTRRLPALCENALLEASLGLISRPTHRGGEFAHHGAFVNNRNAADCDLRPLTRRTRLARLTIPSRSSRTFSERYGTLLHRGYMQDTLPYRSRPTQGPWATLEVLSPM